MISRSAPIADQFFHPCPNTDPKILRAISVPILQYSVHKRFTLAIPVAVPFLRIYPLQAENTGPINPHNWMTQSWNILDRTCHCYYDRFHWLRVGVRSHLVFLKRLLEQPPPSFQAGHFERLTQSLSFGHQWFLNVHCRPSRPVDPELLSHPGLTAASTAKRQGA